MYKEKIYSLLQSNNISIEKDIFDYGFTIFITYLKYLAIIYPIAFILKIPYEVTIFILLFIPLRRYIGGYHLNNMTACLIASSMLAIIIPLIALSFNIQIIFKFIFLIICVYITYKIGTIDHPNKQISIIEKKKYTNKSIEIELIYSFISITVCYRFNYISNVIFLILIFCAISSIVSYKCKI